MHHLFQITTPFQVSDGTLVSPFLNAKDSMSGLPFNLLDGVSVAAGTIQPRTCSKIHLMPHVAQITFVRRGQLRVGMKGPNDAQAYEQDVAPDQAVLTEPGVFFQLINNTDQPCEVLYIVTPAYLFEKVEGQVVYDDSLVLDESWAELKAANWQPKPSLPTLAERQAAELRMAKRA